MISDALGIESERCWELRIFEKRRIPGPRRLAARPSASRRVPPSALAAWPANREQRAPIIGEWLSAEAVSSSLRLSFQNDTPSPRFPPWTVDEYRGISYVVRDANNFAVTYVYFESGPS
jgi:hypothetical protein